MKLTEISLRRFRFNPSPVTQVWLKLDVEVMFKRRSDGYLHYCVGEAISGTYKVDFIMFCNPFGDL